MPDRKLKPGWRVWRFDQMAVNVNDRIDDPSQAGVDRYVGLEHLDPESLKIRRWGSPSEVEATKLIFRKGDIIFGRRRAYQRKLAVADFDGICSAHAMVLRARPDVVLPEFLPFFMQSDLFMNRAVEISVGSLSPTINWKTLAQQEFALPSAEEQRRAARLLQAVDRCAYELTQLEFARHKLQQALIEKTIASADNHIPLGEIAEDIAYGCSKKAGGEQSGVPILGIPNVLRMELDTSKLQSIQLSPKELLRYSVEDGDILVVRTNGNPEYVGRCVTVRNTNRPIVFASYLLRVRLKRSDAVPEFVTAVLNAPSIRQKLRGDVRSSAGNYNVNIAGLSRQHVPSLTLHDQMMIVEKLASLKAASHETQQRQHEIGEIKVAVLASLECPGL